MITTKNATAALAYAIAQIIYEATASMEAQQGEDDAVWQQAVAKTKDEMDKAKANFDALN